MSRSRCRVKAAERWLNKHRPDWADRVNNGEITLAEIWAEFEGGDSVERA